jgi:hypothetical protein
MEALRGRTSQQRRSKSTTKASANDANANKKGSAFKPSRKSRSNEGSERSFNPENVNSEFRIQDS